MLNCIVKITFKTLLLAVYILFYTNGFAQSPDTKIGNQIWKTENLNVNTFRNGDVIKQVRSNRKWKKFADKGKPAWCYYENKSENGAVYGKLYNWYAVNDPRGLSPIGWHIPDDKEWIALAEYLGGEDIAGEKMKTVIGWKEHLNNYSNGNNSSIFTASPGGYRFNKGMFFYKGSFAYWWSSSEDASDADNAIYRDLGYNKSNRHRRLAIPIFSTFVEWKIGVNLLV